MYPWAGSDVTFTIGNRTHVDRHGRETVTFERTCEPGSVKPIRKERCE